MTILWPPFVGWMFFCSLLFRILSRTRVNNVIGKELNYYLTKQNPYGLPLDSRKEYTKSDWIMWTAAMSSDKETFQKFSDPVYKYINETVSRVPISDWHHTDSGKWVGFRARSVIGGYWMKVLMDKVQNNQ